LKREGAAVIVLIIKYFVSKIQSNKSEKKDIPNAQTMQPASSGVAIVAVYRLQLQLPSSSPAAAVAAAVAAILVVVVVVVALLLLLLLVPFLGR
jgi:hypothetical protein